MTTMAPFACRACGATAIDLVVALGTTPLANALPTSDRLSAPEPRYPLDLVRCRNCSLVQITETVPPEVLFREYVYFSSFSDAMIAHARTIVDGLVADRGLNADSLAVEVASNDGYLLQFFRERGIPVLGIEPAENIARLANERGIRTIAEFFDAPLAHRLVTDGIRADVLIGNNVLAHVADLRGFVRGVATLLGEEGVAQFEFPYVKDFLDNSEFDTVYHEHLCYFSLTALERLFAAHGLRPVKAERLAIHGGSLRVRWAHAAASVVTDPSVRALLAEERSWGVNEPETYAGFARRVTEIGADLRRVLGELKASGKQIAAYGAAAKGSTLLNVVGIGSETLDFVADRSPHKQGRYMPGVHVPIVPPETLLQRQPDYTLLLTWNFADEILAQQAEYRRRGGRFILPIPRVKVI